MFRSITIFITKWNTGSIIVFDNTVKQVLFTGIGGLRIVSIAGIGLGILIPVMFLSLSLPHNLVSNLYGQALSTVIIRELGPLFSAFIVISRSGTAIATEIGNMNANKEFDALKSMGIDVIHFIIAPRIIGMVIALMCLNVYLCFLSVMTSAVVFNFENISFNVFFESLFDSLDFKSIVLSFIKTLGFGFIISTVSCYQGYGKRITFTEVPKVLTKATGSSIVWVIIYYAFISVLSYL